MAQTITRWKRTLDGEAGLFYYYHTMNQGPDRIWNRSVGIGGHQTGKLAPGPCFEMMQLQQRDGFMDQ